MYNNKKKNKINQQKIKKINILLRYVLLSLSVFLIIRYICSVKLNNYEMISIISLITFVMLMLDMYLPIYK